MKESESPGISLPEISVGRRQRAAERERGDWQFWARILMWATRYNREVNPVLRPPSLPGASIGFLLYDLRASGVVRNAFRIAAVARDAGLDARLWPIRRQGDLLGQVPQGVPVEPILRGASRHQRDFDSLCAVPAISDTIRARQPALLFSCGNQMHIHAALALRGAKAGGRVRLVGRASNAVASRGDGLWRRALRPLERFQYQAMDRIVAVSEELGTDLLGTFHLPPDKLSVIPNGVDVALVEQRARMEPPHRFFRTLGPPVILAAGRYARQKNFEGLLRAFALAQAKIPSRLLIVGPGKETEREKLRHLASRLGVADKVAIEGFVENPFAYMRCADLFVLSSLWEGASNVLLEAMACGCPVVATRAPTGIVEVLEENALGLLVPPGDVRSLASAMVARMAQPRNSAALVERARDFDLGRTLAAYSELLASEFAFTHGPSSPP